MNPVLDGMHIRQPFPVDGVAADVDGNPSEHQQMDGMADNGQFMTVVSLPIASKA